VVDGSVSLHPLTFVREDEDEVVIGRLGTGTYAVFPSDGAELVTRISEGMTPPEAAEWYESTYGEPIDMDEFLVTLTELGFVRNVEESHQEEQRPVRFQRLGRMVFSPVSLVVAAGLCALWVYLLVRHSDLRPSPSQVFFTQSVVIIQLVLTFGQLPLVGLHELCHMLAARRLGLPSRFRISNRLIYIVFETEINSVRSVPKAKRYLPFLAGMICDLVVIALLDLAAELLREPDGTLPLSGRVAVTLAFTVFVRLMWQLQLYLRTDLYFVFATALNCYDLHEAGKAIVFNPLRRLFGRRDKVVDLAQWSPRDLRVARWYAPLMVFGVLTMLGMSAFFSIPIFVMYLEAVFGNLVSGNIGPYFWDSLLSLVLNTAQITTLVLISRKERRERRSRAPKTVLADESVHSGVS
jgi:hypothetical protein